MITHFSSVNFYVRNLPELFDFYRNKLGIPCPFSGYGELDGAKLGFPGRPSTIACWNGERWSDYPTMAISLLCDDIFATYEQLQQNGVELEPPVKMVWGGYELRFQDPAGNTITVIEDAGE